MNPALIQRWHCERCGVTHDVEIEAGGQTRPPVLPEGWSYFHQKHVEHTAVRRDVVVTKNLCPECTTNVRRAVQSAPRWTAVQEEARQKMEQAWQEKRDRETRISVTLPPAYTVEVGVGDEPTVYFTRGSEPKRCQCGADASHSHVGAMATAILKRIDEGNE